MTAAGAGAAGVTTAIGTAAGVTAAIGATAAGAVTAAAGATAAGAGAGKPPPPRRLLGVIGWLPFAAAVACGGGLHGFGGASCGPKTWGTMVHHRRSHST